MTEPAHSALFNRRVVGGEIMIVNKYLNKDCSINKLTKRYNVCKGSIYNWNNKINNNMSLDKKEYIKKSKYTPGTIKYINLLKIYIL